MTDRPAAGQSFASHLVEVLERHDAGCIVVPLGGLPEAVVTALPRAATRCTVLRCLDGRHAVALARGYAAASGRMTVALIGPEAGSQVWDDLRLAQADQLPVIAIATSASSPVPDDVPAYHAATEAAALGLLDYAATRASYPPRGPIYLGIPGLLIADTAAAGIRRRRLDRPTSSLLRENEAGLAPDIVQAFAEAEGVLLVVGKVSHTPVAQAARTRLAELLNATVISGAEEPSPGRGTVDLVVGLQADVLPALRMLGAEAGRALFVHIGPDYPEPASVEDGHAAPAIDIYIRATPEVAVDRLIESLTGEERWPEVAAVEHPGRITITRSESTPPADAGIGTGTFVVGAARRENFVAAAVGAAIAFEAFGRPATIRLKAIDLACEATALWSLRESSTRAAIEIVGTGGLPDGIDARAVSKGFGVSVILPGEAPHREVPGPHEGTAQAATVVVQREEPLAGRRI